MPIRTRSGCTRCHSREGRHSPSDQITPHFGFRAASTKSTGRHGSGTHCGRRGGRSASASEYWPRHVTAAGKRERTYSVIVQPRLHLHNSLPELAQIIERPRDR